MPVLPPHGSYVEYHETDLALQFRQVDFISWTY
jgi:hypothetical protein